MRAMLRIVLDTEIAPTGITTDTASGPYMRLTAAAVERAMTKLGVGSVDDLWRTLGFSSRQTFWRARRGLYDIRLTHAAAVAAQLEWPITRAFQGSTDA